MNETRTIAGGAPGWMVVRAGDARVALAVEAVAEVLPPPALSPVPMAPDWVAGIVSVRGDVVPVIDLRIRLGRPATGAEGQLVVVTPDETGERVGLLCDAIAGLIDRASPSAPAPGGASDVPTGFVAAHVLDGAGSAVPILDIAALLDPEQRATS